MADPRFVMSGDVHIATETSGCGASVIYGHGLTGSRLQTRRQLAPVAQTHAVTIYDQRGHGDSDPLTSAVDYSIDRLVCDLMSVLDAVGANRTVLGGNSMGAAVALRFALEHPDRVSALLLAAPAFGPEPNPAAAALRKTGETVAALGIDEYIGQMMAKEWPASAITGEAAQLAAAIWQSHRADSIATACAAVSHWTAFGSFAELAGIHVPVIVVAWPNDEVHTLALAAAIAAHLPDGRLVLYDRRTYYHDPSQLGRLYAEFLAEIEMAGAQPWPE